jgi:hypothetical protein
VRKAEGELDFLRETIFSTTSSTMAFVKIILAVFTYGVLLCSFVLALSEQQQGKQG